MKWIKNCTWFALILTIMVFTSCNGDDEKKTETDITSKITGSWGGEKLDGKTGNRRNLVITFKADHTGEMRFQSNVYFRVASFSYSCNGNIINCKGVMIGQDLEVSEQWEQSFEFHDSYIAPIGAYSDILLYKEGSNTSGSNNNDGNNNDGNSISGSTNNEEDLSYHVGFDNAWPTLYRNGTYTHQIFMGFGISKGYYKKGYSIFGIAIRAKNGTVKNQTTARDNYGLAVSTKTINGNSMKFFSTSINEDKAYEWGTMVYVESSSKTVTLEYVSRYYDENIKQYVDGNVQTYLYEPKEIGNY